MYDDWDDEGYVPTVKDAAHRYGIRKVVATELEDYVEPPVVCHVCLKVVVEELHPNGTLLCIGCHDVLGVSYSGYCAVCMGVEA